MKRAVLLLGLVASIAACNEVIAPGATGGTTGDTGAGTSSGGGADTGGAGGTGGGGTCTPQPEGEGGFMEPVCADLDVMAVTDPVLTDDGGDGEFQAGEGGTLAAKLAEIGGVGFNWYPGVYFESSHPGIVVTANDWFYAIFACQVHPVTARIEIAADVAKGTTATITARVGMLNNDCPDAHSIEVPITVH